MIIIPDTNILYILAEGECEIKRKKMGQKTSFNMGKYYKCRKIFSSLLENKDIKVFIPDWVKIEAQGVWLNKNIDLENYPNWYDERKDAFTRGERCITHPYDSSRNIPRSLGKVMTLENLKPEGFTDDVHKVLMMISKELVTLKMPLGLVQKQWESLQNYKGEYTHPYKKFLDGIDAIILAVTILAASKYKNEDVFLLTDDIGLRNFIGFYKENDLSYPCHLGKLPQLCSQGIFDDF